MRSGVLGRQLKQGQASWRGLPEQDVESQIVRIHRTRCSSLETALWPACWAKGAGRTPALLGHEDLNTTRIYTAPSVHDMTEAVERLGGG